MTTKTYDQPTYHSPNSENMGYGTFAQEFWDVPSQVVTFSDQREGIATLGCPIIEFEVPIATVQLTPDTGMYHKLFTLRDRDYGNLIGSIYNAFRLSETQHGEWSSLVQLVASAPTPTQPEAIVSGESSETKDIDWPAIVRKFAKGIDGDIPNPATLDAAVQIVRASIAKTVDPEFVVDFDGALSIDLRLHNGLRVLAELTIDGDLDAGFYDDNYSTQAATEVEYLPQATAQDLIDRL